MPPAWAARTGSAAVPGYADRRSRAGAPALLGCAGPGVPRTIWRHRRTWAVRALSWCAAWRSWRSGATGRPQHLVSFAGLRYYMRTYPQGSGQHEPGSGAAHGGADSAPPGTSRLRVRNREFSGGRGSRPPATASESPDGTAGSNWHRREPHRQTAQRRRGRTVVASCHHRDGAGKFPAPSSSTRPRLNGGVILAPPSPRAGARNPWSHGAGNFPPPSPADAPTGAAPTGSPNQRPR